jgi:hypothetical protein
MLSVPPGGRSVTSDAVDPLADEVGVAVVARVIEMPSGHGGAGALYFLFECLDANDRFRCVPGLPRRRVGVHLR